MESLLVLVFVLELSYRGLAVGAGVIVGLAPGVGIAVAAGVGGE